MYEKLISITLYTSICTLCIFLFIYVFFIVCLCVDSLMNNNVKLELKIKKSLCNNIEDLIQFMI